MAHSALCNPPYIRPGWRSHFGQILEDAGLSGVFPHIKCVPADILFIAQNLRFLRPSGKLGLILPDGIIAGEKCGAFHLGGQTQRREGSFWLDFFSFQRTTAIGGWRFDGLVVVRGDVVVFRNFGGEARIDRTERQVNPLGPLQRAGDAIGAKLLN